MKKTISIVLLFVASLIVTISSYAQSKRIDSLRAALNAQRKQDTGRVNRLIELGNALLDLNFIDSGYYKEIRQIIAEVLSISDKKNFPKGKGCAIHLLGEMDEYQRRFPAAHRNYELALDYYKLANDRKDQAELYLSQASAYNEEGSPKALENMIQALKIYDELKDTLQLANCYIMISGNYMELDLEEALTNAKAGLAIAEKAHNKTMVNAADLMLGEIYFRQGNYSAALQVDSLTLKGFEQEGDTFNMGAAHIDIADVFQGQGSILLASGNTESAKNKFQEALKQDFSALEIYERAHDDHLIALADQAIGGVLIKLSDFSDAGSYLTKSLDYFNAHRVNYGFEKIYEGFAQLDSARGNFRQAFHDYKLYVAYRDSSVSRETTQRMEQLKLQYEFDKKESEAKSTQDKKDLEAKRTKNIQYFAIATLAVFVLAILAVAMIQYRSNKHQREANALLQEQKIKIESALSELSATQSQLVQSEKMASLGELTAGIAHEIQNPLNFVNNFSEISSELMEEMNEQLTQGRIAEAKAIAGDIGQNLEKINQHGKRADAIVKSMMQHSRANAGAKEPTDINALADECLRLAYHGLRAKNNSFNVTLNTDFDSSMGKVNIIPQDIGRVLLNLYNNAFYAMSEKKKMQPDNYEPAIFVSTKKQGGKLEIKVKDNGNGVPQKIINKIFQPFFTTKPAGQGTGLGLSLSYDIVKAHGGAIKVEAKEGEFSEFVVQLAV